MKEYLFYTWDDKTEEGFTSLTVARKFIKQNKLTGTLITFDNDGDFIKDLYFNNGLQVQLKDMPKEKGATL